jgi:BCD family chlorophyll transporter-like MFS transporter
MLLAGMGASAAVFALLLVDFSALRLIQVIQGAAVVTMVLNGVALWKQEARQPQLTAPDRETPSFASQWRTLRSYNGTTRLLAAVALGAAAFSMQDVLLEPYGAEVLGLSVSGTTALTALWAIGALLGFATAARSLGRGGEHHRLAGGGALVGVGAFSLIILSAPMQAATLFYIGVFGVGLGGGLFAVGTLTAAMALARDSHSGLALGVWGAAQATAAGLAVALGGALRDVIAGLAQSGALGEGLAFPATGYSFVYHVEIALLFAALIAIGPLARHARASRASPEKFGLSEFPT